MYITTCIIDWKCLKLIQMAIVLQLAKVAMAPKAYNFDNVFKEACFGRNVLDRALSSLRERVPPLICGSLLRSNILASNSLLESHRFSIERLARFTKA